MMDFAGFSGFENDRDAGAGASIDEVLVDSAHREQGWERGVVLVDITVGDN